MLRKVLSQRCLKQNVSILAKNISRCFCVTPHHQNNTTTIGELNIGQPTPFTHSHLFENNTECTPLITHAEFRTRRAHLMKTLNNSRLDQTFDRHIVVLSASDLKIMSNDIPYFFHQDTDFLYFTGLNEPDGIAVLDVSADSSEEVKFILFVQPKDPMRELWDGSVAGEQAALDYFNADVAFPIKSFPSIFTERYGETKSCIWIKRGKDVNRKISSEIAKTIESNRFKRCSVEDVCKYTQHMRVVKSMAEIKLLRHSASITTNAFAEVMRHTQPGLSENQLFALLEYHCRNSGAQHLSFPPVVAGGARANTLHYINNDRLLSDGDMVLMDGGCVFHGYASDVTRTWPVNGRFTEPQAKLYQIVLDVLKECTQECVEDTSLNQLHSSMLSLLGHQLQKIGIIHPRVKGTYELRRAASRFCPHSVGHYLGMDTHDCPLVHKGLALQNGMVLTVEPGLYIPVNANDVAKEYRGIGIRIEDNVVVTPNGPAVLTQQLPKEIDEIEALMVK